MEFSCIFDVRVSLVAGLALC